jgi:DNA-directed RNA polymerase subunit E'/Rpb7
MVMNITDIYSKAILTKKVDLLLSEVGKNLEENVVSKLKSNYEGICNIDGYIKPDSIKLLTYSSGLIQANTIIFEVVFECELCAPTENSIVKAVVKNITKAGIRAEIINENDPTPLVIFITRDYNFKDTNIEVGDSIFTRIIGTRYELNDKYISVIAELEEEEPDESSKKDEPDEQDEPDETSKKDEPDETSKKDEPDEQEEQDEPDEISKKDEPDEQEEPDETSKKDEPDEDSDSDESD